MSVEEHDAAAAMAAADGLGGGGRTLVLVELSGINGLSRLPVLSLPAAVPLAGLPCWEPRRWTGSSPIFPQFERASVPDRLLHPHRGRRELTARWPNHTRCEDDKGSSSDSRWHLL